MDLYTYVYILTLFLTPLVTYLLLVKSNTNRRKQGTDNSSDWYYPIKYYIAKYALKKQRCKTEKLVYSEKAKKFPNEKEQDYHLIYAADQKGNCLLLKLNLKEHQLVESTIFLKLNNGNIYSLPDSPEVTLTSTTGLEHRASGLEIQILEPYKRLRIVYNGLLSVKGKDISEHIRFNFVWTCAGQPIFHPDDANLANFAAALATQRWRDGQWLRLLPQESYYEQYGALKGSIIGETFNLDLNLASFRKHFRGIADVYSIDCDFSLFVSAEDGTTFNLGTKRYKDNNCRLKYGNLILNNGKTLSLEDHDLILMENENLPDHFVFHFKAADVERSFKCVVYLNYSVAFKEQCTEEDGWTNIRIPVECDLNAQQGRGVLSFWRRKSGEGKPTPSPLLTDINKKTCLIHFAKPLDDDYCKNLKFSGGKANSLALLTSLHSTEFGIPPGVVVFVAAFKFQITKNERILNAIENLESVAHGISSGHLKEACDRTNEIISSTEIHDALKTNIITALEDTYKKYSRTKDASPSSWQWAVRSSAIGEDSTELSAAGQNSTYLGCKSEKEIFKAIAKCWASSYSYISVQYRRQNGLPIKCDMAVLIQKMVMADCAGVLFTCEPASGNRKIMVLTSNYGLGESVVSGKSEPDTVILERDLQKNKINVQAYTIGSKNDMITLNLLEGGIKTERVIEDNAKLLSVTEEQSLRLGHVGNYIEKSFGCPLDIEWAYQNNDLFILQARPITTLTTYSEKELTHECDTAILSEEDTYLTKANIGEVMPGALTVLSASTTAVCVSEAMEKAAGVYQSPYTIKALFFHQHHAFLQFTNMFSKIYGENDTVTNMALDLSVFGHLVRNDEMVSVVLRHYGKISRWQKLKYLFDTLKCVWGASDILKKAIEINKMIDVNIEETDDANIAHKKIQEGLIVFAELARYHAIVSRASVFYQFVAMNILARETVEITPDHYHDISLLFACHENVISADIPKKLQQLAKAISEANLTTAFLKTPSENCVEFLEQHPPNTIHKEFIKFLAEQGHRSLREFELQANSWGTNPATVIDFVKNILRNGNFGKTSKSLSIEETVAKLVTTKSNVARFLLKFIVSKSRNAVARREATKCELSRFNNKLRRMYALLANKLKAEGKIPDTELIYHFSDYEIGQIIADDHPPVLVKKALLRRRLYHKWDVLKFPEICRGIPIPESKETIAYTTKTLEVKGTPVCMGEVQARACVIVDLQDVEKLQQGDILITYSTDTAWSLYFPMISGIATELGGLISHGAVIAREFCLPCIVGTSNATRVFKTGDIVYLSGTKGILRLVKSFETQE